MAAPQEALQRSAELIPQESHDTLQIRGLAREFVASPEFAHYLADAIAQPNAYPYAYMRRLGELGFLAMDIPPEAGGDGFTPSQLAAVIEETSYGGGGMGLVPTVQTTLTSGAIARWGTEEQRTRFLPDMITAKRIGAFLLTEPRGGSDAKGTNLRAVRDETRGGWVVNGEKTFITSARAAFETGGVLLTATRTRQPEPGEDREKGMTFFAIDLSENTEGLTVGQPFDKLGQPGSPLHQVFFKDYFIPDEPNPVMGEVDEGWAVVEAILAHSRNGIAAQAMGIARRGLDEAIKIGETRALYERHLVDLPKWRLRVELMTRQLLIAQYALRRSLAMEEAGHPYAPVGASLAKLAAAEAAVYIANQSLRLHGGSGYINEYSITQVLKDAVVLPIYEGTDVVQENVLYHYGATQDLVDMLYAPSGSVTRPPRNLPPIEEVFAAIDAFEPQPKVDK